LNYDALNAGHASGSSGGKRPSFRVPEGDVTMFPAEPRKRPYRPRINARKKTAVTPGTEILPADCYSEQTLPCDAVMPGDAVTVLRRLPDRCVDLVILDPPYWKVVGETWDYRWRTEADYRLWCHEWFTEVARVVKRSASLYLFGYLRNLVYLFHDLCALGFEFRQEIIVDKGIKSVAGRKTSTYKQFPNTTETIFFFVYDAKPAIRQVLLDRQKQLGLTAKQVNERLGVKTNGGGMWSLYTGDNILAQVPTAEMWSKLEVVLDFKAPEDLKGYVFQPQLGLTNVWQDIDFYAESRIHPTQKPRRLVERLILASSLPGQVVLDPFAGSGTTAVAAKLLGRRAISVEIDADMAERANNRLAAEFAHRPTLFGHH
jgi:DNA modification methylase